jgi:hypothetical protein
VGGGVEEEGEAGGVMLRCLLVLCKRRREGKLCSKWVCKWPKQSSASFLLNMNHLFIFSKLESRHSIKCTYSGTSTSVSGVRTNSVFVSLKNDEAVGGLLEVWEEMEVEFKGDSVVGEECGRREEEKGYGPAGEGAGE